MTTERLILAHKGRELACWSSDSGSAKFDRAAPVVNEILLLQESTRYGLQIEPCHEDLEYRVRIGDHVVDDLAGAAPRQFGSTLQWPDCLMFDSAAGQTTITVEKRSADAAGGWQVLLAATVFVVPSKAGEAGYAKMSRDVAELSRALLSDLYGKSTLLQDVRSSRRSKGLRNPLEELHGLEKAINEAERVLRLISAHPSSRIESLIAPRRLRGDERLTPRGLSHIARRGQGIGGDRTLLVETKRETFDIAEHRALAHAIESIAMRAQACRRAFAAKIEEIEASRAYRDVRFQPNEPSLFETDDVPRLTRLSEAIRRCDVVTDTARGIRLHPLIRHIKSAAIAGQSRLFLQSAEYRRAFRLIRALSGSELVGFEGSDFSVRSKETWRLFEQWCYLEVVEAFRRAGAELAEWDDGLRAHLQSRFVLDFKRGMAFDGRIHAKHRLRIRYEPWILGEREAKDAGESLFRGRSGAAWSPDIAIELQRTDGSRWSTVYAIILDAKYSRRVGDDHWKGVRKYEFVRSTATRAQVRCLGIIALDSSERIEIANDDGIDFSADGVSCSIDDRVDLVLYRDPLVDNNLVMDKFAQGMLRYMRRNFIDFDKVV
jgi:hypothetical protein